MGKVSCNPEIDENRRKPNENKYLFSNALYYTTILQIYYTLLKKTTSPDLQSHCCDPDNPSLAQKATFKPDIVSSLSFNRPSNDLCTAGRPTKRPDDLRATRSTGYTSSMTLDQNSTRSWTTFVSNSSPMAKLLSATLFIRNAESSTTFRLGRGWRDGKVEKFAVGYEENEGYEGYGWIRRIRKDTKDTKVCGRIRRIQRERRISKDMKNTNDTKDWKNRKDTKNTKEYEGYKENKGYQRIRWIRMIG